MKRTPLERTKQQTVVFRCKGCKTLVKRARQGEGFCRSCSQSNNARSRSNYVRTGETRFCLVCGSAFYAGPAEVRRGAKFCSNVCNGLGTRKQRVCTICGQSFENKGPRKTCSRACWIEAGGRAKRGSRNPGANGETESRERWFSSAENECRKCGTREGRRHLHHVVYEQHVRKAGGDVYAPENGLTLCFGCHMGQHHSADGRVSVSTLRSENLTFAFSLLGAAAFDYFIRYYDVDARHLLERHLEATT